ncbi:hypothetical protein ABT112_03880 [Streptomyces sp. NPDC002055]|uniref:hypothetical protein n=1 Tax=Streptomyces sp. NPDC002055 TaxID=3154534 RepID=UPI003317C5B7
MGCWTAYALRAEDGTSWIMREKWGRWDLTDATDRMRLVESVLRGGTRVGDGRARVLLDGPFCCGAALDLVAHRYRYYGCDPPDAHYLDCHARRRASASDWDGWDVEYAWGGRDDLADMVAGAEPAATEAETGPDLCDAVPLTSREGWFVGWDPGAWRISVLHSEIIADFLAPAEAVVSLIRADHTVLDHQLTLREVVPWLARHGESLTGTLPAHAPYPMPMEETVNAGVVVDVPARRLRYWTTEPVPSRLTARTAAAWPGWRVERLPLGFVGHLAATGRTGADLLLTDSELRDRRWDEDLVAMRNTDRRALRIDPRNLRTPRVEVVEEGRES